jgi:hypothetical protein
MLKNVDVGRFVNRIALQPTFGLLGLLPFMGKGNARISRAM